MPRGSVPLPLVLPDRTVYRADTERIAADVRLADGSTLAGDLHLHPAAGPAAFETPLAMLNRPEPFFAMTLAAGGVVLLPRASTALVRCADPSPPSAAERHAGARTVTLDVELRGGERLHGWARWELPAPADRTLDFLNGPERFFAMSDGEETWLINRAHVRAVYPLDD